MSLNQVDSVIVRPAAEAPWTRASSGHRPNLHHRLKAPGGFDEFYLSVLTLAIAKVGDLMALSKRLRFEILRRDGHCCRYCGEHASPEVKLTVDHVLPVALGGTDTPSNLVACCRPCNAGKAASSPDAPLVNEVTEAALLWAEAVSAAQTAARVDLSEKEEYVDYIGDHWAYCSSCEEGFPPRPSDWEGSIDVFRRRGMPLEVLTDAASLALNSRRVPDRDKWTYFMGIAWRRLTEIEEDAKRYYDYVSAKRAAE